MAAKEALRKIWGSAAYSRMVEATPTADIPQAVATKNPAADGEQAKDVKTTLLGVWNSFSVVFVLIAGMSMAAFAIPPPDGVSGDPAWALAPIWLWSAAFMVSMTGLMFCIMFSWLLSVCKADGVARFVTENAAWYPVPGWLMSHSVLLSMAGVMALVWQHAGGGIAIFTVVIGAVGVACCSAYWCLHYYWHDYE